MPTGGCSLAIPEWSKKNEEPPSVRVACRPVHQQRLSHGRERTRDDGSLEGKGNGNLKSSAPPEIRSPLTPLLSLLLVSLPRKDSASFTVIKETIASLLISLNEEFLVSLLVTLSIKSLYCLC